MINEFILQHLLIVTGMLLALFLTGFLTSIGEVIGRHNWIDKL